MPVKDRQKISLKRFIPSPLFLILGVAVLILFSVSLAKELIRRYEVNREINQLRKEVDDLEKRNAELADLLQYLNTESFKEKEARTKLGMAKPGEKVIVIPGIKEEQSAEEKATSSLGKEMSNPQKWWNYFFNQ